MKKEQSQGKNPYNICIWRPADECKDCPIIGRLKCRFNSKDLFCFIGLSSLFFLPSFFGIIRGGYGWYILGWVVFMLFFFEVWEIRILCSHCPYYAEKGRTLHCIANFGCLKIWKYNPEPMNTSEKVQLMIGVTILFGYPFPFLILGKQFILALLAGLGAFIFFWALRKYTCPRCVNFSCPLNRVSKDIADEFLKRNPIIEKANYLE